MNIQISRNQCLTMIMNNAVKSLRWAYRARQMRRQNARQEKRMTMCTFTPIFFLIKIFKPHGPPASPLPALLQLLSGWTCWLRSGTDAPTPLPPAAPSELLSDNQSRLGLKVLEMKMFIKIRWNSDMRVWVLDSRSAVSVTLSTVKWARKKPPPDLPRGVETARKDRLCSVLLWWKNHQPPIDKEDFVEDNFYKTPSCKLKIFMVLGTSGGPLGHPT
jgi:hypothetical protein